MRPMNILINNILKNPLKILLRKLIKYSQHTRKHLNVFTSVSSTKIYSVQYTNHTFLRVIHFLNWSQDEIHGIDKFCLIAGQCS